MASTLNHRHALNFLNLRRAGDEFPHPILIRAIQPHLVVFTHVHRTPKHICPIEMRGVEMRVGDDNSFQSTFFLDKFNRLIVEKSHTVPEYISTLCLQENRALPDTQLFFRRAGISEAGR
jgi:hypothetical protein